MTVLHRFRIAARQMFCAALAVSIILPAPPPAMAQQPGDLGRAVDAVT